MISETVLRQRHDIFNPQKMGEGGTAMAVLVTGGAGYIGSHTCVELLNSG